MLIAVSKGVTHINYGKSQVFEKLKWKLFSASKGKPWFYIEAVIRTLMLCVVARKMRNKENENTTWNDRRKTLRLTSCCHMSEFVHDVIVVTRESISKSKRGFRVEDGSKKSSRSSFVLCLIFCVMVNNFFGFLFHQKTRQI